MFARKKICVTEEVYLNISEQYLDEEVLERMDNPTKFFNSTTELEEFIKKNLRKVINGGQEYDLWEDVS